MADNVVTENKQSIEGLLQEERKFSPSPSFQEQANINDPSIYEKASQDPEAYWADWASKLSWMKPWEKVLDWHPPYAKWFVGGENQCICQLSGPTH